MKNTKFGFVKNNSETNKFWKMKKIRKDEKTINVWMSEIEVCSFCCSFFPGRNGRISMRNWRSWSWAWRKLYGKTSVRLFSESFFYLVFWCLACFFIWYICVYFDVQNWASEFNSWKWRWKMCIIKRHACGNGWMDFAKRCQWAKFFGQYFELVEIKCVDSLEKSNQSQESMDKNLKK